MLGNYFCFAELEKINEFLGKKVSKREEKLKRVRQIFYFPPSIENHFPLKKYIVFILYTPEQIKIMKFSLVIIFHIFTIYSA